MDAFTLHSINLFNAKYFEVIRVFKSIERIHQEYDGKWVFLINCVEGEHHSIAGGEVALSSERRDKVLREMEQYINEPSETLIFYAGNIPKGVSVLL